MPAFDLSVFDMHPAANERFVVRGDKYRITVLTEQLLRLEYSEDGIFEDRATRFAFNRAFSEPEYRSYRENGLLHIVTKHLHLRYDEKPFSEVGLQIYCDGTHDWRYGAACHTLGGTIRTLDAVNGAKPLGEGLLSRGSGFATVDDSKTIAINPDGWPVPLIRERTDLYFFGYNRDYERCIADYYRLTSPVPLFPRYALGNWWSRYHRYTDTEYLELMDRFNANGIPFSVAVVDMDWHLTQTPDPVKYGGGWTGYTWNRELFPDHCDFLRKMHERGMKVTLNLHPRDGIRAFEEVYPALCRRLGRDPAEEKQVEFDVADRSFMEAYFDTVLRSLENEGVDFWWIDWQQKGGMSQEGYDVLWMLNHCHYTDNARRGERPVILSRYAGLGSHRYPFGFSGDTYVTWESLDFQPYFTATAANVGFSWWSHDIGGHMGGIHDDELYTRWIQLGVFSPVMRIHSSPNPFTSREPWNYGEEAQRTVTRFMRLRHRLIPYLYTMMYRNTCDGIPMVRPVYHKYPDNPEAYSVKNEYLFGDSLLCAPVTSKRDPESRLAKTSVWLPQGTYIDVFTGRVYSGNRLFDAYRPLDAFPLFAKAGAIIPLSADAKLGTDNPRALELRVFGGDSGSFTMREDNGLSGSAAITADTGFSFCWGEDSTLTVCAPDCSEIIPADREYTAVFTAFEAPSALTLTQNGVVAPLEFTYDTRRREVRTAPFTAAYGTKVTVTLSGSGKLPENEIKDTLFELLNNAQYEVDRKCAVYDLIISKKEPLTSKLLELAARGVNGSIAGAVTELITAQ